MKVTGGVEWKLAMKQMNDGWQWQRRAMETL